MRLSMEAYQLPGTCPRPPDSSQSNITALKEIYPSFIQSSANSSLLGDAVPFAIEGNMSLLVHQDPSQPIDYKSGF